LGRPTALHVFAGAGCIFADAELAEDIFIRHHLMMDDCNRFARTNAVNQSQFGSPSVPTNPAVTHFSGANMDTKTKARVATVIQVT
jgi:hypothetical protein